jgi:hypothetical protein
MVPVLLTALVGLVPKDRVLDTTSFVFQLSKTETP